MLLELRPGLVGRASIAPGVDFARVFALRWCWKIVVVGVLLLWEGRRESWCP